MKIPLFIVLPALSVLLVTGTEAKPVKSSNSSTIKANYKVESRYNIAERGAIGDGKTLNSKAIQMVIDECAKNGGGTMVIPKGIFLSGSLFLKPGVNIELQEGAVLKGSTDINDYEKLNTRVEGHFTPWRAALINGDHVDHLRISGPGTLDGSGELFYKLFYNTRDSIKGTKNLDVERPRLMLIQNSKDVKISGIYFLNSGFWNLHLYRCQNVIVEDCRFEAPSGPTPNRGPSSDGIDIDSSQDVIVRRCSFSVGDDCIALKGSKGPFAMEDKDSPPVERILIEDCIFEAGGGIVTFGSEATIVRDVEVRRCITKKPTVLRLKLRPDTPQQYENIRMSDITMENGTVIFKVSPWTQYFDLKGEEPPKATVRNIVISNVKGNTDSFGLITGHPQAEISDILLKNVDLKVANTAFELGNVTKLRYKNVKVNGKKVKAPEGNK